MRSQLLTSLVLGAVFAGLGGWLLVGASSPAGNASPPSERAQIQNPASTRLLSGPFTLAVSWQPAFCETAPEKPECRSQNDTRFDASNFTLHGLWPDPAGRTYCGVSGAEKAVDKSGRWSKLPALDISPRLSQALEIMMPGTQSGLERHEWIKHGTCSGGSEQDYYAASLALLTRLNDSEVRDLFARSVGQRITAEQVRLAFDRAFGAGAGQRVTLECERLNGRTLVSELRISLVGDIAPSPEMNTLLLRAKTRHRGCPAGEVDRVGIGR